MHNFIFKKKRIERILKFHQEFSLKCFHYFSNLSTKSILISELCTSTKLNQIKVLSYHYTCIIHA